MNAIDKYTVLKEITKDVWHVKKEENKFLIKRITINNKKEQLLSFKNELQLSIMMGKNNIGPKIHHYFVHNQNDNILSSCTDNVSSAFIVMEKMDGDLTNIIPFVNMEVRDMIIHKVDTLIKKMHKLDVAHGDLHARNIVYKEGNGNIRVYIIDFGYSFKISEGGHDPKVLNWMQYGFDWNEDYKSFVEFDLENWKNQIEDIPILDNVSFQDIIDNSIMYQYMNGDCGIFAISLRNKSGWPMYAVSLVSGKDEGVPAHYILRAPGGQLYVDITGIWPTEHFETYWRNYFLEEGELNFDIKIHEVDDVMCNKDYYDYVVDKIGNDDVEKISSTVWQFIQETIMEN